MLSQNHTNGILLADIAVLKCLKQRVVFRIESCSKIFLTQLRKIMIEDEYYDPDIAHNTSHIQVCALLFFYLSQLFSTASLITIALP